MVKSYMVYIDKYGNVCAYNKITDNIDFKGVDSSKIINQTLNNLTFERNWKEDVILYGNLVIKDAIKIPSYTILKIFGKLSLANNINNYMIKSNPYDENIGQGAGAINIEINGGILDANYFNQSQAHHTIEMTGVNNISVSNIKLINGTGMGLLLLNCENVQIQNIYISSTGAAGRDGIHLQDCKCATVNGIRGNTYDDLVGITNLLYDSSHITVNNIAGKSTGANIIDIGNEEGIISGKILSNIAISNIVADTPALCGIQLISRNGGVLRDITINNFSVSNPIQNGLIATGVGGTLENISITNFNIRNVETYRGIFLLDTSKIQICNGCILDAPVHSIDSQGTDDLLILNVNIKTNGNGITIESGNRITLENINADASIFPFQIGTLTTTVNNLKMINCYSRSQANIGIDLQGSLINSIISNNDLTENTTGIFKDKSYKGSNVIIKDNIEKL